MKDKLWAGHAAEWRDPAQIASQWRDAGLVDRRALESKASRGWWDIVENLGVTLFVTREHEHLVMALSARGGQPRVSFLPMPHPSGVVADRAQGRLFVASTRNPNQVYTLKTVSRLLAREDVKSHAPAVHPMVTAASVFYPGCLYLHDLALFGKALHANAVGHNCVVRLLPEGRYQPVWWPKCVEARGKPVFGANHIQLNSIAAGRTPLDSFYSASSTAMERLRPGHVNYPVDGRGVIFSGRTREPMCTGLTRPHSARLLRGQVWVDNSGYGELGFVREGRLEVVSRLPGWTRGLCMVDAVAFVGVSRVIPRFARYAPGLEVETSQCSIHAIDCRSGEELGNLKWPYGNQIFAIDWLADKVTSGFPFEARFRRRANEIALFYSYCID